MAASFDPEFLTQLARELTTLHIKCDAMRGLFIRLGIRLDDIDTYTNFVTNHPDAQATFQRILRRLQGLDQPES